MVGRGVRDICPVCGPLCAGRPPHYSAEGGAGGFKVVGIVIGAAVHSQPLAIAMGAFGASRSIFNNFMARGTDVVLAKHTAMEISVDTRGASPEQTSNPRSNPKKNCLNQ